MIDEDDSWEEELEQVQNMPDDAIATVAEEYEQWQKWLRGPFRIRVRRFIWRTLGLLSPVVTLNHRLYSGDSAVRAKPIVNGKPLSDAYMVVAVCGYGFFRCFGRDAQGCADPYKRYNVWGRASI